MTIELTYLVAVMILALVQVLLPAAVKDLEFGLAWGAGSRDQTPDSKNLVVARLERARTNLYETLPLFIGAVLIAHVTGQEGALTLWGAAFYFWARVAYVPLYASGLPYLRSLVWLVSLAGLIMILTALFI